MTINKSQEQSLHQVSIFLSEQVFIQDQLYVALSRATSRGDLRILSMDENHKPSCGIRNIMHKEIFSFIPCVNE